MSSILGPPLALAVGTFAVGTLLVTLNQGLEKPNAATVATGNGTAVTASDHGAARAAPSPSEQTKTSSPQDASPSRAAPETEGNAAKSPTSRPPDVAVEQPKTTKTDVPKKTTTGSPRAEVFKDYFIANRQKGRTSNVHRVSVAKYPKTSALLRYLNEQHGIYLASAGTYSSKSGNDMWSGGLLRKAASRGEKATVLSQFNFPGLTVENEAKIEAQNDFPKFDDYLVKKVLDNLPDNVRSQLPGEISTQVGPLKLR